MLGIHNARVLNQLLSWAGLRAGPLEGSEALPYKGGALLSALSLAFFLFPTSALQAQEPTSYTHDPIKIGKKKIEVGKGRKAKRIESVTLYCLGCHGDDAQAGEAPSPSHSIGSPDHSHPTDIAYPSGTSGYRAADQLDQRLVLYEGRVSCITCHDVQDSDHRLVISPAGGDLCTACHQR